MSFILIWNCLVVLFSFQVVITTPMEMLKIQLQLAGSQTTGTLYLQGTLAQFDCYICFTLKRTIPFSIGLGNLQYLVRKQVQSYIYFFTNSSPDSQLNYHCGGGELKR